jgi:iron-sulfur cluster repair protein YtfE (RIC family)
MNAADKNEKPKYYDLISLIESEQDVIFEKLTELEKYAWRIDRLGLTEEVYNKVKELTEFIFNDVSEYFTLEEDLLFPELEKVMPEHSSSAVMRDEHGRILKICISITDMLGAKDEAEKSKDVLQAEIISLVDVLQRHIRKKNQVLYHEVQTMIPAGIQQEIYLKMLKKIKAES